MPLLRGHHLICLHFFNGEGYNAIFINNLRNILSRAEEEEITVSSGADDVCESCPWLKEGRCRYEEDADKAIQEMDSKALELLRVSRGDIVGWVALKSSIHKIFSEWFFRYCTECNWKGTCEKNAFFRQLSERS